MKPENSRPDSASSSLSAEEFDRLVADQRPALLAYVTTLLPHPGAAEDVVQQTLVFLWERRDTFQAGTSFRAWSFKSAYFKALSCRRDLQRERVTTFSDDLLQRLADAAERESGNVSRKRGALDHCLQKLPGHHQQLLHLKYVENCSLTEHAHRTKITKMTGKLYGKGCWTRWPNCDHSRCRFRVVRA